LGKERRKFGGELRRKGGFGRGKKLEGFWVNKGWTHNKGGKKLGFKRVKEKRVPARRFPPKKWWLIRKEVYWTQVSFKRFIGQRFIKFLEGLRKFWLEHF